MPPLLLLLREWCDSTAAEGRRSRRRLDAALRTPTRRCMRGGEAEKQVAGSVCQRCGLFAHLHASCSARTDVDDGAREMTADTTSLISSMRRTMTPQKRP